MVTQSPDEKEPKTPRARVSDEDAKIIERARRRGTATDILGTMVFEDTDKVEIEDILGESLVLLESKDAEGKHGVFVVMHFIEPDTGKHISAVTGGAVVVRKVHELAEKKSLPCMVTLVKVKDYYDLT